MGAAVNERTGIFNTGGKFKVDVKEEPKITLRGRIMISFEETAKVKMEGATENIPLSKRKIKTGLLQMKLLVLLIKKKSGITLKEIAT